MPWLDIIDKYNKQGVEVPDNEDDECQLPDEVEEEPVKEEDESEESPEDDEDEDKEGEEDKDDQCNVYKFE